MSFNSLLEGIQNDWHYRFDDLESLKANMNKVDSEGRTLLHHAVLLKRSFWIRAFIYAGMNINLTDKAGNTALDVSLTLDNNEDNTQLLVRYGAQCKDIKKLQEQNAALQQKIELDVKGLSTGTIQAMLPEITENRANIKLAQEKAFLKCGLKNKQDWYTADDDFAHCLQNDIIYNACIKVLAERNAGAAPLVLSNPRLADSGSRPRNELHHEEKKASEEEILKDKEQHKKLCGLMSQEFDHHQDSLGIFYGDMYGVEKNKRKGDNYTREGSVLYCQLRNTSKELGKKYTQFKEHPEQFDLHSLEKFREELIKLYGSIIEASGDHSDESQRIWYARMQENTQTYYSSKSKPSVHAAAGMSARA